MTREQATQEVRSRWKEYLSLARKNGYICPLCDNGTGESGDGLKENPNKPNSLRCFKCDFSGDIVDLIGEEYGLSGVEKFNKTYEVFGITIDNKENSNQRKNKQFDFTDKKEVENKTQLINLLKSPTIDLSAYVTNCIRNLKQSPIALNYCKSRGFTDEFIKKACIGYDLQSNSLVIPYKSEIDGNEYNYYICRGIGETKFFKKAKSDEYGKEPLFNDFFLKVKTDKPVYVVESQICALSIIQAGGQAVALGGTNINLLINALQINTSKLYISLDNDDIGKQKTKELTLKLDEISYPYEIVNISGEYKDPNEHLTQNKETFYKIINNPQTKELEEYKNKNATANYMQKFKQMINDSTQNIYISTQFKEIDKLLDGGLYAGLYVIGAISSLGKTTLSLQIADNIAENGTDVLFFSLEMAKSEIISKSISRETMKQGNIKLAKTTRGIMTGKKYANYSEKEKSVINTAIDKYTQYGANMYIFEGLGSTGVNAVRETIKKHIEVTGNTPVVFIDYLQILAPYDTRATDKQNTDKAVLELKKLSRDYNLTVFVISSFNRENYTNPVNTASFKESGAIEYSSDVLIGLQYSGIDYQQGEKDKDRLNRVSELINNNSIKTNNENSVNIDFKVLKNRNGRKGNVILEFYPTFNYFKGKEYFVKSDDENHFKNSIKRF